MRLVLGSLRPRSLGDVEDEVLHQPLRRGPSWGWSWEHQGPVINDSWVSTGWSSRHASCIKGLFWLGPTLSTLVVLTHLSSITAFCDISPMLQMRKLRQQKASILARGKTDRLATRVPMQADNWTHVIRPSPTTQRFRQGSELIPGVRAALILCCKSSTSSFQGAQEMLVFLVAMVCIMHIPRLLEC